MSLLSANPRHPRVHRPGFATLKGVHIPAVTAAEMRALDAAADTAGYGLSHMVEHAGRHLAELCQQLGAWQGTAPRVMVLAGSGGNGAGALAAARHLANMGADVRVVMVQPPSQHSLAVTRQLAFVESAGATILPHGSAVPPGADLVLDGIVGYGLLGPLRGPQRLFVQDVAAALVTDEALVVSLDVPTGMDPDTGEQAGSAIRPAATLTVALPKRGLLNPAAGDIWLADIGIPRGVFSAAGVAPPPVEVASGGLISLRRVVADQGR